MGGVVCILLATGKKHLPMRKMKIFYLLMSHLTRQQIVCYYLLLYLVVTVFLAGFHDREGQQYCQQCFLTLFASRCQGCSQPILENYISALNSLWHPQCFVCRVSVSGWAVWQICSSTDAGTMKMSVYVCQRDTNAMTMSQPRVSELSACCFPSSPLQECYSPFVNGSFFEHEGQPLCEAHYHQSRGSVCQACQQPILGRCVTAMGAKFHPHHLVCHFCLKPLSKGCFKEQENKPYCHPCFIKLFG